MRLTEALAQLPGTYYVTRQAVYTPALARKCKKAIRQAFENQKLNKGVSFVEVTSNCNSGWKMTAVQANKWMEENTLKYFPLGDMKVDGKFDPKFIERVATFDQPNETLYSLRKK
jgi:2-oxoglutarate ferredoxin oxidoreductase subunit beta